MLLAVASILGWREFRQRLRKHPEQFPWTELRLSDPIGPFTGIKLAALGNEPSLCLALLRDAGLAETPFEQRPPDDVRCRFEDGVQVRPEAKSSIAYSPGGLVTSCPVAAALALWERDVVQPAARRHLGSIVVRIDHAGSYNCRRINGASAGPFSEHATADAVDLVGFRLADGRRISVLRDWPGDGAQAAFLREARTGACRLFATVLSPDYNRAHADHFHFDQADRGTFGWRLCR